MTLPLFLFCDVSRYRSALELAQAAAMEHEEAMLAVCASVSVECIQLETPGDWKPRNRCRGSDATPL